MPIYGLILLILLGIALLLVEFLIIPGITIAGISGFLCMIYAIYVGYSQYGNTYGTYTLLAIVISNVIIMYYAFRSKTWKHFGLASEINSKNVTFEPEKFKVGDTGETITRMAPVGKVMINDISCEAKTLGEYLDPHTEITIIKINNNQLIVQPKNK